MPSTVFTSIDQLPVSLNVSQVAAFLGISKATAYTLFHSDRFPSLYVGRKLIVPRDRFIEWLNTAVDENKQDHIDVSPARKQTRRNNDESN